jgi:biopolymer transport protein ExbD
MHTQFSLDERHDAAHGIDLAPMLDFVVNLLIFFIVTAVFVKESAITVRRPTNVDDIGAKPTPSIAVLANGDIVMDGLTVDVRAVRANVERLRAVDEHAGLVIVAEARAPMGALIGVVDQAHLGGIYDITFTTTE